MRGKTILVLKVCTTSITKSEISKEQLWVQWNRCIQGSIVTITITKITIDNAKRIVSPGYKLISNDTLILFCKYPENSRKKFNTIFHILPFLTCCS
jgi:hypothetical protein